MHDQLDERATPANRLCKIIQIDQDVDAGWKCLNNAEKNTAIATKNCMKPSVEMFLAFPISRKSKSVKSPALSEAKHVPPNNLTMKKLSGTTNELSTADGVRSAVYSMLGKVKFESGYGGLRLCL